MSLKQLKLKQIVLSSTIYLLVWFWIFKNFVQIIVINTIIIIIKIIATFVQYKFQWSNGILKTVCLD